MLLSDLARSVSGARLAGDGGVDIAQVRDDSRHVGPGDLFVAVRGLRSDGHDFVDQAIARGAAAVAVESARDGAPVPQLVVPSGAVALGELAAARAGHPARVLDLVAITGTNGKTTTTYLVEWILAAAGRRAGVIGTVNYRWAGRTREAPFTTPTSLVLHDTLRQMAADGCTDAVMETSSAAIDMDRLAGLEFRVAAFTNLTQDHLDVHATMDAYRAAKAKLFSHHLAADGTAVINIDDPAAESMLPPRPCRVLRVSSQEHADADVSVTAAESSIDGIRATIVTPRGTIEVTSRALLGGYNVDNIAMAVAIATALEIDPDAIARGIADMPGVPGRVERVVNAAGLDILVDYAHTPDALTNVLSALRPLTRGRLICVFGCGGDRDPGKRPRMGAAVAAGADLAVVTSDNPRTESAQAIIDMILPAVPGPFAVDIDRRVAIRAAIAEAVPGDVVVIAGKGHEEYQILGTTKIHFDDCEEAEAAIALRTSFAVDAVVAQIGGNVVRQPEAPAEAFGRVVIDSRNAAPGDLYVAIHGDRLDGHAFCDHAIAAGATGVIVASGRGGEVASDALVIEVPDPREALGKIARFHRRRWGKTVVAVTGSAGKTTTKDLVAAALGAAGRVHRSAGSLNNETGVPQTLLRLRAHHDFAVVEMGMRGLGQIAYLADIAEPDVGAVVNAGVAHVGVVGSVDAIARGKGELFAHLRGDGTAVHPADDSRLSGLAETAPRRMSFGFVPGADLQITAVEPHGARGARITAVAGGRSATFSLALVGRHNALNAGCALAAALAAGVDLDTAVRGIERARPPALRGEIADIAGRHVLIDCYNANPAAMEAALIATAELGAGGAGAAVIGDMLELGDEAEEAHRAAGCQAASLGLAAIAIGELAPVVVDAARAAGGRATIAASPDEAAAAALAMTRAGDWILVKGSRKMRLERVVDALRRHDGNQG